MKLSTLLCMVILFAAWAGTAFGQPGGWESAPLPMENPLDYKRLAKDKYATMHAKLGELKQARFQAALVQRDSRYKEFLSGRGTLVFLFEAARCALKSQLALCSHRAERIAALEDYWSMMHTIEEVNRSRCEAGRIPVKEYRQSTFYRIDAEQRLRAEQGRK